MSYVLLHFHCINTCYVRTHFFSRTLSLNNANVTVEWMTIEQAFLLCVFAKLKGQNSSPFSKLKAENSRSFPKTQCTGGFSMIFSKKENHFVANFVCKTQKLCWKLLHFDVKSILWLKNQYLSPNLAIFI